VYTDQIYVHHDRVRYGLIPGLVNVLLSSFFVSFCSVCNVHIYVCIGSHCIRLLTYSNVTITVVAIKLSWFPTRMFLWFILTAHACNVCAQIVYWSVCRPPHIDGSYGQICAHSRAYSACCSKGRRYSGVARTFYFRTTAAVQCICMHGVIFSDHFTGIHR
jgi:hypothetical protein